MSVDVDSLLDRRQLRRKVTFWRIAAFLILAIALISLIAYVSGAADASKKGSHIARIEIDGVITDDYELLQRIERIREHDPVKGVIVAINSPGGSTTGGEAIYSALRKLAEDKPVVSEIRTEGASAGYMIAMAGDHTIARYNSITGSIGVLFQYGNFKGLLDTIGVNMDAVKSSDLKAEPDFYSEASPEAKAMLAKVVKDSYDWFVDLVAERRNMDRNAALKLADGSIYSGYTAHKLGLIDAIGGEEVAIQWLESEKDLSKDLPVITWRPEQTENGLPFVGAISRSFGIGVAEGLVGEAKSAKGLIPRGLTLDGLVSVWQAPDSAANKAAVPGGTQ
ncbi:proteinase IV protein [Roseibium sp. TrichSKD4]|uniref:signal peptide peptidase SppA n=1 Tax=Roseibium sp. TrichSKD4 TaxID=744980 RepID=UPI0001E5676F|nr:signal peptide peptidase SppA [Roseibium sp. TrichSKD4]EFO32860.1 proteinase IV protein [Roseibium sp. TrichSKD4]